MDLKINKLDEVWTADKVRLGLADKVYRREEDVDPRLELYESYLEVENFDLGYTYYVPFEFIKPSTEGQEAIQLTVDFKEVLEKTWSRIPHFVARAAAKIEGLPDPTPIS